MSLTRDQLLKIALAEKGYKESPAGSNKTKYGKWYPMDGSSWCAMYVSWCFRDNLGLIDGKFARTDTKAKALNAKGLLHKGHTGMEKGDIVFFAFYGSGYEGRYLGIHHVGLVLGRLADGRYITLEGNTSQSSNDNGGEVQIRYRAASSIAAYFRPKYASVPAKSKSSTKSKSSVQSVTHKGVVTAKSGLRIRKGPGAKYGVIDALPYGTKVIITQVLPSWYKIKHGNSSGYVSRQYVRIVS